MFKIYYNKFWNGTEKSLNILFERIFHKKIIDTNNYLEADILCDCECNADISIFNKKKWVYTFFITMENHFGDKYSVINNYSCVLSGFNNSGNRIKFPYLIERVIDNGYFPTGLSTIPSKNVCAVISNSCGSVRNSFLSALDKTTRVDYGGTYKNNIGYSVAGDHGTKDILDFYKQYKFVVAMENSVGDFYITEKIYNALKAGTIPIYWGSPNVFNYCNSKRFICLKNESHDEILRVVNLINTMNDEDYIKMVNEPIFVKPFDEILDECAEEIRKCIKYEAL